MQPSDAPVPPDPTPNPQTPGPGEPPPQPAPATASTPASPQPGTNDTSKEEKTWAMAAHLGALLGYIGVPLGNVIAPLVIWLVKKDTMPLVDDQAKEALNFQITVTIGVIIGAILTVVCVGWFILIPVAIAGIVFSIIGAIKANDGIPYRYPVSIRLVK